MKINIKTIGFVSIILLSSCTNDLDFARPPLPSNNSYISESSPTIPRVSQHISISKNYKQDWWTEFNSEKLTSLINKALNDNPTLQSIKATLHQTQELYNAKHREITYPQINIAFLTEQQRFNPAISGQNGEGQEFSLYNTKASLNYIFDLSGKNRHILEALAAKSNYQLYELEGARLNLAANIAINTIMQAGLVEQIKVTKSIFEFQKEQLDLAQKKVKLGQIGESEIQPLQINIQKTSANIAILGNILQQNIHQLAILVGQEPSSNNLPSFTLNNFTIPSNLPLILPSDLVRLRPDILASESLLRVANAEYGVAISKLYPQITLRADIGSIALSASSLFGSGSAIWSLAGQITQSLFSGKLSAEKQAALAKFNAAVANYKIVVLEALRNVADMLYALEKDSKKLEALSLANAASQKLVKSIRNRYKLGAASYFELLAAQEEAKKLELDLIDAKTKRLINIVSFFQSLGGYRGYLPP